MKFDGILCFNLYEFERLARYHLSQLEAIYIGERLKGDYGRNVNHVDKIITKIVQNCPKLKRIHLKGDRLATIQNQTLLALFRDFNVTVTLHPSECEGCTSNWGPQWGFICRQNVFENYMRGQDTQLYEKYMKMKRQTWW